jgi:adenylate cyclase
MRIEIERKFLVANDGWRSAVTNVERLRDGLVGESNGAKVRVRLGEKSASLTVKSHRIGMSRSEFEYDIPKADAEAMLTCVCGGRFFEKTRHTVENAGSLWVVDIYEGRLAGIILAEIELDSEHQPIEIPAWAGPEVTNNPRFHKRTIERLCHEEGRPLTISELLGFPPERLLATV